MDVGGCRVNNDSAGVPTNAFIQYTVLQSGGISPVRGHQHGERDGPYTLTISSSRR